VRGEGKGIFNFLIREEEARGREDGIEGGKGKREGEIPLTFSTLLPLFPHKGEGEGN